MIRRTVPVGSFLVHVRANSFGEWALRVEPGALQVDNYHSRGHVPHVHLPGAVRKPVDVGAVTLEWALKVICRHLATHGLSNLPALVEELRTQ